MQPTNLEGCELTEQTESYINQKLIFLMNGWRDDWRTVAISVCDIEDWMIHKESEMQI